MGQHKTRVVISQQGISSVVAMGRLAFYPRTAAVPARARGGTQLK